MPRGSLTTAASPGASPGPAYEAWVVGANGTILATADNGVHWRQQASGSAAFLESVAFCDAAHGWAVGYDDGGGVTLATTDGGQHWSTQLSGTQAEPVAVACSDADHAWAAASLPEPPFTNVILATADGGATWTTQLSKVFGDVATGIAFADQQHGWATSSGGVILRTSDGGARWHAVHTAHLVKGSAPMQDVACSDTRHAWAVGMSGGGFPHSCVLATRDGGASWTSQPISSNQELYSVFFCDRLHGWAAPLDGTLRRTINGGKHWQTLRPRGVGKRQFHRVAFRDPLYGWVLTTDDRILRSKNGGLKWHVQWVAHVTLAGIDCLPGH